MSLTIGGKAYQALLDSGATCSIAGPKLIERFPDRLEPSNARVQAIDGSGGKIAGKLPVMLEVDGRSEGIRFKAVKEADQQILLGMDFIRAFQIDVGWRKEQ